MIFLNFCIACQAADREYWNDGRVESRTVRLAELTKSTKKSCP